jgi:molecular chaperone DnaK
VVATLLFSRGSGLCEAFGSLRENLINGDGFKIFKMPNLIQIDLGPRKQKVVGIDLGTTNSLVAYMDGDTPRVIADGTGDKLVPSVVSILNDEVALVGLEAKHHLLTDTDKTVYSVKRLMGKSFADIEKDTHLLTYRFAPQREGLVRIQIGDKAYTPIEFSAMILKELRKRADDFWGEPIAQAVITVPAYFNDAQRQATKDAGKLAGLDVLRIVNEPTAAALAYGLDRKRQGTIAVYDLGGGTFDISILRLKDGVFEVLATNGDTYLGGDDIDGRLMELVLEEIQDEHGVELQPVPAALQAIRETVEKAKCDLSFTESVSLKLDFPEHGVSYKRRLTRIELETLTKDIVDKTRKPCEQALKDARVNPEDLDAVVLVGGVTRMPLVKRTVEELFGQKPYDEINPDEVVALGAAVQADILVGGRKDILLLDVTPLSLGIETLGGVMSVLIPRNTTIPTKAGELFTTFVDSQTGVNINVYQGERELVKDNRKLGEFVLKGIPPMPAGMPKVEVSFIIDADGILQVKAKELRTGIEQSTDVKPSYGLTDEEVERMLRESFEFAQVDIQQRMLIESRNGADMVIKAIEKSLPVHGGMLEEHEKTEIERGLAELRESMKGEDYHRIQDLTKKLDEVTRDFAQKIMNSAVKEALKAKKITEV